MLGFPTGLYPVGCEGRIHYRLPRWPITCPCQTLSSDRAQVRSKCAARHFARRDGLPPLYEKHECAETSIFGAPAPQMRASPKEGPPGALLPSRQRRQTIAVREVALGALRAHLGSVAHEYPDSRCLRQPSDMVLETFGMSNVGQRRGSGTRCTPR